jgi:hypothetical protein
MRTILILAGVAAGLLAAQGASAQFVPGEAARAGAASPIGAAGAGVGSAAAAPLASPALSVPAAPAVAAPPAVAAAPQVAAAAPAAASPAVQVEPPRYECRLECDYDEDDCLDRENVSYQRIRTLSGELKLLVRSEDAKKCPSLTCGQACE